MDPHKGSHTDAAIDDDEHVAANNSCELIAGNATGSCGSRNRFTPRVRAVEGATGVGLLSAQQLVVAKR